MKFNSQWKILAAPEDKIVNSLAEELKIPQMFSYLLAQKNIIDYNQAKEYFKPELSDLHNPFLMKDMDKAVNRILLAIENQERILIYGDYDVDGTTSVSMMYLFMTSFHENLDYYIPDRYNEGYGISYSGINYASDNEISLIISLDCGIRDVDKVEYAKSKNIDFIICDHHEEGKNIPDAVAVLNPKRKDCNYPFKELSGCGVGFKLIQAISQKLQIPNSETYKYLDLVAVSIAADIVPITGENRTLAFYGIKLINTKPRKSLKIFIPDEILGGYKNSDIVFKIAPRINAAGRLEHANKAIEMLISDDRKSIEKSFKHLDFLNSERKNLEKKITNEALEVVEDASTATIVFNENWHKGVIGIVASRLIENYYKPTLVFTKGSEGELVASARSIENFDIYEALIKTSKYFTKFGGHKYAAGLSLKEENFESFKNDFEEIVSKSILSSQKIRSLKISKEVNLNEITDKFFRLIQRMEPFGPGNYQPLFLAKNVKAILPLKLMGKDKEHANMSIKQEDGPIFSALLFNAKDIIPLIETHKFDIVFSLECSFWKGITYNKLLIKDINFQS